jgi:hypothetical protein
MLFDVTYTHDRVGRTGITYTLRVEARDEDHAAQVAGMARTEHFMTWFHQSFYRLHRVHWERLSVVPVGEKEIS